MAQQFNNRVPSLPIEQWNFSLGCLCLSSEATDKLVGKTHEGSVEEKAVRAARETEQRTDWRVLF